MHCDLYKVQGRTVHGNDLKEQPDLSHPANVLRGSVAAYKDVIDFLIFLSILNELRGQIN
jgi:hypothetical protein